MADLNKIKTFLSQSKLQTTNNALFQTISFIIDALKNVAGGITQLTGDVLAGPGSGSQEATIVKGAITNTKLASMIQATIKGRAAGAGTGAPEDLTGTQVAVIVDAFVGDSGSGGLKGEVPAPAAGDAAAGKFLGANGAWAVPAGSGGITQLTGDVTAGPGSGSQAATLANTAVTPGSYTNTNLTVDSKGRITTAANGSGGGSGNITSTGAEGSQPGSPSSGDLYFPNNGIWEERYSGSAWVPWGPIFPLTDPALQAFTWINQGTATLNTTPGGVYIEDATAGSLNLRIRNKAVPGGSYTITSAWLPQLVSTGSSGMGIGWRDSVSGKCVIFSIRYSAGANLVVDKYTSPTVFSASYLNVALPYVSTPIFLRIADNGANRICSWSTDGQNFRVIHTIGRTDFLTADSVFFGLYINTVRCAGTLLSWKEA